jgi:hypothetical protein
MEVKLNIPKYSQKNGMKYNWEPGFCIDVHYDDGVIVINANKAGLLSLANHLINLSQDEIPLNHHIHLDEYNSLENGSKEVVIQKNS